MLKDLRNKLIEASFEFNTDYLWYSYSILFPDKVLKLDDRKQKDTLLNIIKLVRFALERIAELKCYNVTAAQYFELFCGKKGRGITLKQRDILAKVVDYIVSNGNIDLNAIRLIDQSTCVSLIKEFENRDNAQNIIDDLASFIIRTA